jgi:hypothetical protein
MRPIAETDIDMASPPVKLTALLRKTRRTADVDVFTVFRTEPRSADVTLIPENEKIVPSICDGVAENPPFGNVQVTAIDVVVL